ncbi:hypothetical protein IWX90DRAFT_158587 [Phyllosticta citrichinensis]|uniref:Uncharacterized protein n=1 Tax=Phyllosticta citrichinensis TaxID=1130410 RepID=A0ABR1Y080_9PEZI
MLHFRPVRFGPCLSRRLMFLENCLLCNSRAPLGPITARCACHSALRPTRVAPSRLPIGLPDIHAPSPLPLHHLHVRLVSHQSSTISLGPLASLSLCLRHRLPPLPLPPPPTLAARNAAPSSHLSTLAPLQPRRLFSSASHSTVHAAPLLQDDLSRDLFRHIHRSSAHVSTVCSYECLACAWSCSLPPVLTQIPGNRPRGVRRALFTISPALFRLGLGKPGTAGSSFTDTASDDSRTP